MENTQKTTINLHKEIASIIGSRDLVDSLESVISTAKTSLVDLDFKKVEFVSRSRIREISNGINVDIFGEEDFVEKSSEKSSEKSLEKIINLLKKDGSLGAEDIAKQIGISSRAVEKNIMKLKESKILRRIGPDKGGHWEVIEKLNDCL